MAGENGSAAAPAAAPTAGFTPPPSPPGVKPGDHTAAPARARASDFQAAMEARNERVNERRTQAIQESSDRSLQRTDPGIPDARDKGVDGDEVFGLESPVDLESERDGLEPKKPGDEGKALDDQPEERQQLALPKGDQELLTATKEWMQSGVFPEALENVPLEWIDKGTGALRRQSIAELKEGNMRQSEFSGRMGQVRQYEQQVQMRDQANNQFWNDFQNPDKMLEQIEDRGYGETFEAAVLKYAERRAQMKRLAQAAGYAVMQQRGLPEQHPDVITAVRNAMAQQQQNRAIEIENRKLLGHNRMLAAMRQQQDTQAQQQQRQQELGHSLAQLLPTALKSAGVRNSPANTEAFYRHLNAYVATLQNWDGNVRRQHCVTAAKMVREELEDMAASRRGPAKQQPQSRALPPNRGGQSGSAQPVQSERARPSEFASRIMGR